MPPIDEGREPVMEVELRSRISRLVMLPMEEGIEPVRQLKYRWS
jgi:hypothetical protein